MGELLNLQGQMFCLVAVGMILKKKGILLENAKTVLTDLLLSFILPCNIINSFRMECSMETFRRFGNVLICAVLIQAVSYALSKVLYHREPEAKKRVLQYVTIVSNSGFLGLPIAEEIFGSEGLMYASVFIIPMRIMMWTAGIACFTGKSDKKAALKKVLIHPCIVAVYIGMFLLISQLELPQILDKTIRGAGGCTTTVSMLVIGLILAEVDLRHLIDKAVWETMFIRLFVLPAAAFAIAKLLGFSEFLTGIAAILTAMPTGSSSAMLAAKYDGDYKFASKCIVCTTIASMLTIPLWCAVL